MIVIGIGLLLCVPRIWCKMLFCLLLQQIKLYMNAIVPYVSTKTKRKPSAEYSIAATEIGL